MANTTDNDDIVVFQDSAGNEISNDPRWHARRILGLQQEQGVDPRDAELEELRAFKRAHENATPPNSLDGSQDTEDDEEEDDDDDEENPYAEVKGKALAALAKERDIKLVTEDGTKLKAGEVRAALAAQDISRAATQ